VSDEGAIQMLNFLQNVFDSSDFMPRRSCGNWTTQLAWLHLWSDALIWLAYVTIAVVLISLVRRRRDLPFPRMFWMFAAFIVTCGFTHFLEAAAFYWPAYRLMGVVKLLTAVTAWATVAGLIPLVPRALALPSPMELQKEIDDRTRAERTLAWQASLLDVTHDSIMVVEMDGTITYWNYGAEVRYGLTREEALGSNAYTFLQIQLPQPLPEVKATLLREGQWEGEVVHTKRDGSRIVVASRWVLQRDERGQPMSILRIGHLITACERAEEALRQRTAELEMANKELEAFSYSVSHDLRAPLRAIDGLSRILLEDCAEQLVGEAKDYLQSVRANAQQMGWLVDDLLALARISRQPVKKQTLDPAQLVQQSIHELLSGQDGRRIEILVGDLPPCAAEPTLLKQVWTNLLSNAVKYTRGHDVATIEVGCRGDGDPSGEKTYFVRDNGVGFDMRYADKLFGVFQRLHRAEDYEGTGVGLAIVQRIIHRHGGRVWAEAQPGQGATFFFTLGGGIARD